MTADDGTTARARRVKDLFDRALDLPEADRASFLGREGASPSVRDEVEDLLRREAAVGAFLEVSAAERLLGPAAPVPRLAAGERVGAFTVLRPIGEGGGGVVYEAEQDDPRRRVALKLVRTPSPAAVERFRSEAASLARLHHPAIAHVYAAGVLETAGRRQPWIAMELIDGARSIVRHAREERLGLGERLRLFAAVCDALDHAHRRGVVHRDVTPGNVLVDAEGLPKVVDFGVACSAVAEGPPGAVGTLPYASPEQLSRDGASADLRADVWGLGALLYEILAGAPPHPVEDLPLAEAVRVKRAGPPAPPSSRAAGVPPDLDAIVLHALEPSPDDRYGSAAALAADVRRFLAHEPVAAHRGGALYPLRKFVRRRRAVAAGIAGTALALVAGTAGSVWFAVESASERRFAERRSYVAEISAAAAALRVDDVAEARRRLDRAPAALRDWEWRHLASRLDGSAATVRFPGRELWDGAASADGSLVALAGTDRSRAEPHRFAALATGGGTILREWPGVGRNVPAASIAPDGSRFAAGFDDGRVVLWDVARGEELGPLPAHAGRVIDVTFDASGARFASVSADGSARVWTSADGALLAKLADHSDHVICAAFDPTSARLATGCRDGSIRIWDTAAPAQAPLAAAAAGAAPGGDAGRGVAGGTLLRTLLGHEGSVEGLSVSRDGALLASVSRDRSVRLWRLADGAAVSVARSHSSNVRDVAFDPSGPFLVTASWDGTIRVWDAASGTETRLLRGHASAVSAVFFLVAEPRLASLSIDGTLRRWDARTGDVPTFRDLRGPAASLDFDPEGGRVAVGGPGDRVAVLDAATARVTCEFRAGGGAVAGARFTGPTSLVVLSGDRELEIWDVSPDRAAPACVRRRTLENVSYGVLFVGRSAESAGAAGVAWLARCAGGPLLTGVDAATGDVVALRNAPVVVQVAATDGRGGFVVGDRGGRVACSLGGGAWAVVRPDERIVRSVAFDPAGERVVAASDGGPVRVLRASDLATLAVLEGHSAEVYDAAFLPGGRRIVTASRDRTVRLWDAESGENVLTLHEHGYPVTSVAVSPDGSRIATAAGTTGEVGATVKIWAAPEGR